MVCEPERPRRRPRHHGGHAAGPGHISNAKSVGSGVFEYKIEFGPGYRVYFGKDGDRIVILLGGTKKRQHRDIADAIQNWRDYKHRK